MKLVELAETAHVKASKLIPEIEAKYSGIGKIRQIVKSDLSAEILQMDKIVRKLIVQIGTLPNSIQDYLAES